MWSLQFHFLFLRQMEPDTYLTFPLKHFGCHRASYLLLQAICLKVRGAQECIFASNEILFCRQVSLGLLRRVLSTGYLQEVDT